MKYLLDTCTVSDFVKGQPGVLARMKATAPNQIVVSSITRMEIDYGLALNSAREKAVAHARCVFLGDANRSVRGT